MPYKRRGRRKRSSRRRDSGPSPSRVTIPVFNEHSATVNSETTTVLWTANLADIANVSGETQNRKITRVAGTRELLAQMTATHHVRVITGFFLWPSNLPLPTVAQWDPFDTSDTDPSDPAGNFVPQPVSLFGRRDMVHTLPSGAPASLLGEAERVHWKPNRLIKPGFKVYYAAWARGDANIAYAHQIAVTVEG